MTLGTHGHIADRQSSGGQRARASAACPLRQSRLQSGEALRELARSPGAWGMATAAGRAAAQEYRQAGRRKEPQERSFGLSMRRQHVAQSVGGKEIGRLEVDPVFPRVAEKRNLIPRWNEPAGSLALSIRVSPSVNPGRVLADDGCHRLRTPKEPNNRSRRFHGANIYDLRETLSSALRDFRNIRLLRKP